MTAKEYLRQYGQLKREVLRLIDERQRWVDLATRITPSYSDAPKGGQSGDGKIPAAVEKIVEQERRIDAKIAEMAKLLDEIEKLLGEVGNPDYRLLLELRYLQGLTWEQIAERMRYSRRHVIRLHGSALLQMQDVLVCHSSPVL
jgi:RNA polymerase sigma factor (sigma-70 family)